MCWGLVGLGVLPGIARREWITALVCPLILGGVWMHFEQSVQRRQQFSLLNLANQEVAFYGTVCDTMISPSGKRKHVIVDVRSFIDPQGQQNRGKLLISMTPEVSVTAGDHIVATGSIERPEAPKYKWDFNAVSFLNRFGATAEFMPLKNSPVTVIPHKPVPDPLNELRIRIVDSHNRALGKRYGNLLTSMVIGNRNVEVDPSISLSFRNLGLSHMLAASGFNLSIVVATTWCILRPLIRNRLALNLFAAAMMMFYSLLAGVSASIERAAIMCAAMLLGRTFIRSSYVPGVLALTLAITLLVDPFALSDVGLQLSYVATAALICTSDKIGNVRRLFRNSIIRYTSDVTLACVAAVASVLPLQLYYFWQTGLLQLPANAVVSPLIPVITVEGFITSALACMRMEGLGGAIDQLIGLVVRLLMVIVDWLNSFSWSVISTGPPAIGTMVAYYVCLAALFMFPVRDNRYAGRDSQSLISPLRQTCWLAVSGVGLLVTTIALLNRPPLPPLTVIRMHDGTVAIDSERNALVVGSPTSLQLRRCLAYFGTKATNVIDSPSGATARFQWETVGDEVIVILRTNRKTVRIKKQPHCAARNSIVREYR
jgi:ComEC/Rec2-related protein